jgi:hypothetical protein
MWIVRSQSYRLGQTSTIDEDDTCIRLPPKPLTCAAIAGPRWFAADTVTCSQIVISARQFHTRRRNIAKAIVAMGNHLTCIGTTELMPWTR